MPELEEPAREVTTAPGTVTALMRGPVPAVPTKSRPELKARLVGKLKLAALPVASTLVFKAVVPASVLTWQAAPGLAEGEGVTRGEGVGLAEPVALEEALVPVLGLAEGLEAEGQVSRRRLWKPASRMARLPARGPPSSTATPWGLPRVAAAVAQPSR
jgi:hypothetical protein